MNQVPYFRESSNVVWSPFMLPKPDRKAALEDVARGGINFYDTTKGMDYQDWQFRWYGGTAQCRSLSMPEWTIYHSIPNAPIEFCACFDQNMRPSILTQYSDGLYMYWYNSIENNFVSDFLGSDRVEPRLILDDVRAPYIADSDMILFARNSKTFLVEYAVQRERFQTWRVFSKQPVTKLYQAGMNTQWRIQVYARV